MNEPRAGADAPKDLDAPGGRSRVVLWLEGDFTVAGAGG
jgi:hypothetical protein